MNRITSAAVPIQTSSQSVPCSPFWFGEIVLISSHLCQQSMPAAINERVRYARRRFGHYEVIDFLVVFFPRDAQRSCSPQPVRIKMCLPTRKRTHILGKKDP